jgi:hypothetical protein
MARSPRRSRGILLVVLVVLFVNLPLVQSTWTRWRVDTAGTDVTAEVTGDRVLRDGDEQRYWLGFRFPEEVDPEGAQWSAEVDEATYDEAVDSGEIEARVLPDRPSAYRVEGQVRRPTGLITTLVADAVLLVVGLLVWRSRRRTRGLGGGLVLTAVEDLRPGPPGAELKQVEGDLHTVRGVVWRVSDDEVVLDLGDREVRVLLDGHDNPIDSGEPAEVRGRLLG